MSRTVPLYAPQGFATLEEALEFQNSDRLLELGLLILGKSPPVKKAERMAVIISALAGDGLRQFWEQLDPLSKSVVAEVVHGPEDWVSPIKIINKYGSLPRFSTEKKVPYARRKPPMPLALFFYSNLHYEGQPNCMPHDLKQRLQAFVPPPAPVQLTVVDELPATVELCLPLAMDASAGAKSRKLPQVPLTVVETERAALHDLGAVLRLVEVGKLTVSDKSNQITAAGMRTILPTLRDGDFIPADWIRTANEAIRAFAWPLLLQSANLAKPKGSQLVITKTGKEALSKPPHEVIKQVWSDWLSNTLFDEFLRLDAIRGKTGKGKRYLSPAWERRMALDDALSACPPERWFAIADFFKFMHASGFTYQVTSHPWTLYIGDVEYGNLGGCQNQEWSAVLEGTYALVFLWEYAATLGILDIAHFPPEKARYNYDGLWGTDELECLTPYDGLYYVRITPLGAYCLGQVDSYTPAVIHQQACLKVLPNWDVVVTDREVFQSGDGLFLDRFGERTGESTWRLLRDKCLEAAEAGAVPDELAEFLTRRCSTPIPEVVTHWLEEMAQRATTLKPLGKALFFSVRDAFTAEMIAHDRSMRGLCWYAGQARLVVPMEQESAFRKALRRIGYGCS